MNIQKPTLFFIFSLLLFASACSNKCKNTICENGGLCQEGECWCREEFGGETCTELLTPHTLMINKIESSGYRLTDSAGNTWDEFEGPDLQIVLFHNGDTILKTEAVNDCSPFETYEFSAGFPYQYTYPLEELRIGIFDKDENDLDWISGYFFIPNDVYRSSEYPDELVLNNTDSENVLTLFVDWEF